MSKFVLILPFLQYLFLIYNEFYTINIQFVIVCAGCLDFELKIGLILITSSHNVREKCFPYSLKQFLFKCLLKRFICKPGKQ